MKTVNCEVCGHSVSGEDFQAWFKAMHAHWTAEHADVMAEMAKTGTKEEGEKWMAENKAKFEAAPTE